MIYFQFQIYPTNPTDISRKGSYRITIAGMSIFVQFISIPAIAKEISDSIGANVFTIVRIDPAFVDILEYWEHYSILKCRMIIVPDLENWHRYIGDMRELSFANTGPLRVSIRVILHTLVWLIDTSLTFMIWFDGAQIFQDLYISSTGLMSSSKQQQLTNDNDLAIMFENENTHIRLCLYLYNLRKNIQQFTTIVNVVIISI